MLSLWALMITPEKGHDDMFHGSSGTFIGIESVILLETNRSKCFKHIQKNLENLPSKFEMCPSQRKKSETWHMKIYKSPRCFHFQIQHRLEFAV